MPDRPFLCYEFTDSPCATCYREVAATVVVRLALAPDATWRTSASRRPARNA